MEIQNLFWSVVIFIYFSTKNTILLKLFKRPEYHRNPHLDIIIAILAVIFNNWLLNTYQTVNFINFPQNSGSLPPYPLIFIITDLLVSAFFIIRGWRLMPHYINIPIYQFIFSIMQFVLMTALFTVVVSYFITSEVIINREQYYTCAKYQLRIDFANYYFTHNTYPDTLAEFTNITRNPITLAPLSYNKYSQALDIEIVDSNEVKFLVGATDVFGLESFKANPNDYFFAIKTMGARCTPPLQFPNYPTLNNF